MNPDWLTLPQTQLVLSTLTAAGHQAYGVGGCVRNSLMGIPAADVDIATSAVPAEVTELFEQSGLHVVPTGIDHGTVTVICRETPFEITTFRKDVRTDGRHAVVDFSDSVSDDARRRDFTMNALYMDIAGNVVDPLGGLPDLVARRVRFIENADQRVCEDYLRILRFFRFHAWYGNPEHGIDPDGLAACANGVQGLAQIAKERIGQEIIKLLMAPDPAPAVAAMRSSGVLTAVLDGADDRALAPYVHLTLGYETDPVARLAAIVGENAADALRLSKAQTKRLAQYRTHIASTASAGALGFEYGLDIARNILALRAGILETPLIGLDEAQKGARAVFPLGANDLMPHYQGAQLGAMLNDLQQKWIASGFLASRADLLKQAGI